MAQAPNPAKLKTPSATLSPAEAISVVTHGLTLAFTEDAVDLLVEQAQAESVSVSELCQARFKDFQFGLKLVAQNTGGRQFTIDRAAAEAPDRALSEWVVASYRK